MDFYHLSGGMLGVGSIIEPGNWGRLLRLHGWNHGSSAREMLLESARLTKFGSFPSRLDCCFAFATLDEAKSFRYGPNGFGTHLLYRVRLTDPSRSTAMTRWDLCSFSGALRVNWADDYWQAMSPIGAGVAVGIGQGREVLTLSPLRIEERLNP